jgi:hypothetical protein
VRKREIAIWIINLELHKVNIQFHLPSLVPGEERAYVTHGIKPGRSLHKV